jgi:3D (Asp-Asp-Asp) domain-containing protein
MHSLRASVLFIIIAVSAFLADNRRVRPPVQYQPEEFVFSAAAAEAEIPGLPAVLVSEKEQPTRKKRTRVTRVVKATAYNAVPEQTDSTPEICAWGDKVRPGIIAISRDLENSGLTRGKEVQIEGIGKVIVMDRMHSRKHNQIDLYMERYQDAVEFGVKELSISWTEDSSTDKGS